MELPPGLREALELPLADALATRRSRRFGLGMTLPSGPLEHASGAEPVPLSELEEAALVWLGTGVTGLALGDLPPDGLSWMHTWIGRSWPCSVNSHSTELFFTNDAGLHVARLRGREPEGGGARRRAAGPDGRRRGDGADLPRDAPDPRAGPRRPADRRARAVRLQRVERQPAGTTLFIPVTNMTVEYLTLLFIYFDERNRFSIVDELAGGLCGLDRWVASGRLGRTELSLFDLELRVLTTLNVEGAFICQNMSLALQALGLGGWAFTGFLPHHVLGADPAHRGLGFDFVTPSRTPRAHARPVPVGRAGIHEALCPPYVTDMREAVERFLAERRGDPRAAMPYGEPSEVMAGREDPERGDDRDRRGLRPERPRRLRALPGLHRPDVRAPRPSGAPPRPRLLRPPLPRGRVLRPAPPPHGAVACGAASAGVAPVVARVAAGPGPRRPARPGGAHAPAGPA